jgi:hypothetical protein
MNPADRLDDYLLAYYLNPHSKRWSVGVGQVILGASEQDREQFRQLRSKDISDFVDNELAAAKAMSESDRRRNQFRLENKRLASLLMVGKDER